MNFSKTRYCRGVQCPKMLWLDAHKPDAADNSSVDESVLITGSEVGDVAMGYFGDYVEVPYSQDKREMIDRTKELLANGTKVICEASFAYQNNFCSVDILRVLPDGVELVEVKSATSFKDVYADDMAYQLYVLTACGLNVKKVCLMHLNSGYVRRGALDLQGLFTLEDCTEICRARQTEIPANLAEFAAYVGQPDEPDKDISPTCFDPYGCAYWDYCSQARGVKWPSVFDIRRLGTQKKFDLYNKGVISFADVIKQNSSLSAKQRRQVETEYYNRPATIEPQPIRDFLQTLVYPIYYLDFETYQQAVPKYDGISPYMQIPFQYSLHIEHSAGGKLEHREFLGREGTDTRRALAERLVRDIPCGVCSVAYNMAFEKRIIKQLADEYPDLAPHLMDIHANMRDLMIPFQDQNYYAKDLEGSYSIKYVLPSLCPNDPELDYNALDGIHNGGEAMNAFARLHEKSPEEIAAIRKNLLAYCRLDTLAMVKIVEKLRAI